MKESPKSDHWTVFSHLLLTFKLMGILPLSFSRTKDKNSEKLNIKFSRGGFIIGLVFLVLTIIHSIWAPNMLLHLERSIMKKFANSGKNTKNNTLEFPKRAFNTRLGEFVKILHPLLVSFTAITARLLSLTVLGKSLPVLFKAFIKTDQLLSVPTKFYLSNFGHLTSITIFIYLFHIPFFCVDLWYVCDNSELWDNVWEIFSLVNIITSFSLELEFVLFCISARSRFMYINNVLTTFVCEEFLYDVKSCGRLKKIFSKWKGYVGPKTQKIFSSNIKAKGELFKLFSKMDAANGGKYLQRSQNVFLIDVSNRKRAPEPETCNLLKSLRSGHILLFDVLERVNDIYQSHLLVSISSSVTKILFNFYFTIFGFVTTPGVVPGNVRNGELSLITLWSLYYCLRFLLIVCCAHFTVSSSREARYIISKIDPRGFEVSSKQEIKMFSDHLSRRDFEFSACGLFTLNTSLISTSFSTGITYLVIMAQFHY